MKTIDRLLEEALRRKFPNPKPHQWRALPAWDGGSECTLCGAWVSAARKPDTESYCPVASR